MTARQNPPATTTFTPLCVPVIRGNEWLYLKECLDTNWVSSVGPFVDRFEQSLAGYIGSRHAIATVNGTAALHTALLLAGVGRDDEVLVSTLTFIAPANAIRYAGAWPVFIDAEPDYWQMDPLEVERFLEHECTWDGAELWNKTSGRRVKAIIPVHILGHPVDCDPIIGLASRYGLTVIEDATESLGARYKGRMVGGIGEIGCFSFNGNKIITTGGGGMIVTNDDTWAARARYLTTQAKDDAVEYLHEEIGYNYRLTNIQAAMGVAQMEQLPDYVAAKRRIADAYRAALAAVTGISPMQEAPWAFSAHWMFTILVDRKAYGIGSRELLGKLGDHGVQTRPLWQPLHLSNAHGGNRGRSLPIAERLYESALSLPCSADLSDRDIDRITTLIAGFAN